ncbi:MAG: type 1 glutamine amidotransferase [Nakamurella sp.]
MSDPVTILILEHDSANPPLLLGDWLTEAGAHFDVRHLHAGDTVPPDVSKWNAVIGLGGYLGVYDDDLAPWLAGARALFGRLVTGSTPTLAIGLSAQLLAVAAGGRVQRADGGYRLGANLVAKRDATEGDLLLGDIPITPDVMQFHRDSISALPGGSRMLLNSLADPVDAFRVGSSAWGLQFHIETPPETLRSWLIDPRREITEEDIERSDRRFGESLDESAELMAQSWRAVAHRFVELVREGIPQTATGHAAPRLPIVTSELGR